MPTLNINSALFGAIERALNLPDVGFDFANTFQTFADSYPGALTALQLSATLIRLH